MYADSVIFSGAESVFCNVVEGLRAGGGFELVVASPPENRELTRRLLAAAGVESSLAVPSQRIRLAAFDLYDPRRVRAVRRVLEEAAADLILLNLPSGEYGATPLLARTGSTPPIVGFMHISGTMGDLGFHLGRIRERLARRAVSRLEAVCLLSFQAESQYPREWSPRGTELNVVPLPAPEIEAVDRDSAREQFGLPLDRTVIGLAGRLTIRQKGHDTLVEAATAMVNRRPGLLFAIAGEGQDRQVIERQVRAAGLEDNFRMLGQVDIAAFLSAIDLITIPSRFEGLPLIALEALTLGVPGVASSVDGLCNVWPAEWRVDPDDPAQLTAALERLLDAESAARQDLVSSGRKKMEQLTSKNPGDNVRGILERAITHE